MTTRLLPKQFSALESFVPDWALPTEAERLAKLTRTSIVDLKRSTTPCSAAPRK